MMNEAIDAIIAVWFIGLIVAALFGHPPTWAHAVLWPLWAWKAVMG